MTAPTPTITATELERAYPLAEAQIGEYVAVTTWAHKHGDRTDMLTGRGATRDAALAESAQFLADSRPNDAAAADEETTEALLVVAEDGTATLRV